MTDRNKMLERARKLFSMANNAGEGAEAEAEIALRRCDSLMKEYGFTEAELQKKENHVFGESGMDKTYNAAMPRWYTSLAAAAAAITDTVCLIQTSGKSKQIRFRGMNEEEQLAIMMFDYLLEAQAKALKEYKKETGAKGTDALFAFRIGFAFRMSDRATEIKEAREAEQRVASESGQSLVVIKKDMISSHFSPLKKARKSRGVSLYDGDAFNAGNDAADKVSLNKQVGGTNQKKLVA